MIVSFSSCTRTQKDIIPSAEYAPYVNAYTGGVISQNSTIRIELTHEQPMVDLNNELKENPFSFSPSLKGKAYWVSKMCIRDSGNLAAMLLREETKCFAFLAGHESFAAAEGAIKIAAKADKVRKEPLRCILNGLGKDAAQIISRINGFTYVQTQFDYFTGELKVVREIAYSDGPRAKVRCV